MGIAQLGTEVGSIAQFACRISCEDLWITFWLECGNSFPMRVPLMHAALGTSKAHLDSNFGGDEQGPPRSGSHLGLDPCHLQSVMATAGARFLQDAMDFLYAEKRCIASTLFIAILPGGC